MSDAISFVVKLYKKEIAVALSFVLIKNAREIGEPVINHTKRLQNKYFYENQDDIQNPILKHRFLSWNQDEILNKLRQTIPPSSEESTREIEKYSSDDESDSDDWSFASDRNMTNERACSAQTILNYANCTQKSLWFVDSILMINEEIERKLPIKTSVLESMLYDEADYMSQSLYKSMSVNLKTKEFSDDSGFGCSEFSRASSNVSSLSGEVVKVALQSSNANQLVMNSIRFVINDVKPEIKLRPLETFNNWKGSLTEYACDILTECSSFNPCCRELQLNLILELLEDLWNDRRLAQNRQWELKMDIINVLLKHFEICYEILQYLIDKFQYFTNYLENKVEASSLADKMVLFLNLYCNVCATIKTLRPEPEDRTRTTSSDCDVTRLWQEKWSCKDNKNIDSKIPHVLGESEV
uniref:Uncharacterized protein n=1 Tax=Graphocephala atropunctata TaxID=36148 RepID=A0A1B6L6G0_9HEMI